MKALQESDDEDFDDDGIINDLDYDDDNDGDLYSETDVSNVLYACHLRN